MKQFFQPHIPAVAARPMLSLEEEAIAISEMQTASSQADISMADADRAVDVTKGVEDVETIISTVHHIDTDCQNLMAAVADMAVAGTDAAPQDLVPGTETTVANEDAGGMVLHEGSKSYGSVSEKDSEDIKKGTADKIKEVIKAAWEKVMAFLKAAFEQIKKVFNHCFDYLHNIKSRIVSLQEKMKSLSEDNPSMKGKKIIIPDPNYFIIGFMGLSSPEQLVKQDEAYMQSVFTEGPRAIVKIGVDLVGSLKAFDPTKVEQWETNAVSGVAKELTDLIRVTTLSDNAGSSRKDNGGKLVKGTTRLGQWRINVNGPAGAFEGAGAELTEKIAKLRFRGETIISSDWNGLQMSGPFALGTLTNMLREYDKMVDHIFYLQRGEGAAIMREGVDAIKRAGEEAANKITDEHPEAKDALNRVMRLGSSYGNWVNSPLKDLSQRSVMYIHHSLNVVQKMMAYYK